MSTDVERARRLMLIIAVIAVAVGVVLYFGSARKPELPSFSTNGAHVVAAIPVEGMSCMACAASVRRAVLSIDGVDQVEVSLEHRKIMVQYIAEKVSPVQISAAIEKLGYRAGEPRLEAK